MKALKNGGTMKDKKKEKKTLEENKADFVTVLNGSIKILMLKVERIERAKKQIGLATNIDSVCGILEVLGKDLKRLD